MDHKFKGGHYTEVPTATAHSPEEVRVLCLVGRQQATVGSYDVDRKEVVQGQAMLAYEPAEAATKGEAREACNRNITSGSSQTEGLKIVVKLTPGETGLGVDRV